MTLARAHQYGRTLAIAHWAQGALLLLRPETVTRIVSGNQPVPPSWLVRALGVRLLTQGLAETLRPGRRTLLLGAAVDVTHAGSMLAAARFVPGCRRAALTSVVSSALSAAASVLVAARW